MSESKPTGVPTNPILRYSEVAEFLRVSTETVRAWARRGKLKRVYIGRIPYVTRESLVYLLDEALVPYPR